MIWIMETLKNAVLASCFARVREADDVFFNPREYDVFPGKEEPAGRGKAQEALFISQKCHLDVPVFMLQIHGPAGKKFSADSLEGTPVVDGWNFTDHLVPPCGRAKHRVRTVREN
jgi:hypothetical protein